MSIVTNVVTTHHTRLDGRPFVACTAETIEIDGIAHRVGDEVLVQDWRERWAACPITAIWTRGLTGRAWVCSVMTGNGETVRTPAELRVLPSRRLLEAS